LVLGGLLTGLLLSEALYRLARHFVCIGPAPGFFEARSWGWMHQPNKAVWLFACAGRRFEYQTYVQFNSQGLRDREYAFEKPTGTRRVLLLGDSTTEAVQVPLERTFAKLVEGKLRAGGKSVEVINGGHSGFGTDNQIFFYRDEARRYVPDLVVLVFNFQNDILENSPILYRRAYEQAEAHFPPKLGFRLDADGTLQQIQVSASDAAERPPPDPTLWQWMAAHVFLLRALERALSTTLPVPPRFVPPPHYGVYAQWDEQWRDAWQLTMRITLELRAAVERSAAHFVVVLLPARDMVAPTRLASTLASLYVPLRASDLDLDRPRRVMTEFLQREGIPFVDLLPALQAHAATGARDFFDWDVHLNESGHAAVSPPIAAFVQDQLDGR
jgi:hypothetical protein